MNRAFTFPIKVSAALAVMAAVATLAAGSDCEVPPGMAQARPAETPTEVGLGVVLVGLHGIRDTDQSFQADIALITTWHDPRLSADVLGRSVEGCRLDRARIWTPGLQIANMRYVEVPVDEVRVDRDGRVLHRQRLIGDFSASMNLRDFPFDRQTLEIKAVSLYGRDEVTLKLDEERFAVLAAEELPGWKRVPDSGSFKLEDQELENLDRSLVGAKVSVLVSRETGYYIWKVVLPLTLIVFMAWAVFWIDPSNLAPQVGLSTSAALTFVAFQLGLGTLLPPIDYLTRADWFIIGSEVLVFLALAEAITAARLASRGREKPARYLDNLSRVAYPIGFFLVLLASFWL